MNDIVVTSTPFGQLLLRTVKIMKIFTTFSYKSLNFLQNGIQHFVICLSHSWEIAFQSQIFNIKNVVVFMLFMHDSWYLKAAFDSRKKCCTCKFKIFKLSKRNPKGAQRSSQLRNKFSTASQIAGKKLLFLSAALFARVENGLKGLKG